MTIIAFCVCVSDTNLDGRCNGSKFIFNLENAPSRSTDNKAYDPKKY